MKPKSVISIHNLEDLLPSKKELAGEYSIFGDGPDVCHHNAIVAAKHGYEDLANVWRFAKLLLYNEVPLETLKQSHRKEPVLVVAKKAVELAKRGGDSDSGLDLAYDEPHIGSKSNLSARVRWGRHPLGAQLIESL